MSGSLERIEQAIDGVEADLFADAPLATMAQRAGYSPWHFHRLFTAVTGVTPAAYVARRRLSEICRRLVETTQPIVDLALDCGFESQATFTRAFTRDVGISPGKFRRTRAFALPGWRYPRLDVAALAARERRLAAMEPRLVRRPAFAVVGLCDRFAAASTWHIPELWARFLPRVGSVAHRVGAHTLGVCLPAETATADGPGCTYVAGVEVATIAEVPEGMMAVRVPAATYAVFTHSGHVTRLADTVQYVWARWLPASRYDAVAAPDFELYDPDRWNPATGNGEIDLYVPVDDAAAHGGGTP